MRNLPFFIDTSISSHSQTNRKSPKTYCQILFCRAFSANHFGKKNFLLSTTNDGTRSNIPKNFTLFRAVLFDIFQYFEPSTVIS